MDVCREATYSTKGQNTTGATNKVTLTGDTSAETKDIMTTTTDFEIEFACGRVEARDLSHKSAGDRRGYAAWLAKQKCTLCWQRSNKHLSSHQGCVMGQTHVAASVTTWKSYPWATHPQRARLLHGKDPRQGRWGRTTATHPWRVTPCPLNGCRDASS